MSLLSSWVDITGVNAMSIFSSLLPTPGVDTGVFDSPMSACELNAKMQEAQAEQLQTLLPFQMSIVKVYDIGIGIPSTVSNFCLGKLLEEKRIHANTPVHLRYQFANLALCILLDDVDVSLLKSKLVYVVKDSLTKTPLQARLGEFTAPNRVYMRPELDGKITTLAQSLSKPYLTSYMLVAKKSLCISDLPQ